MLLPSRLKLKLNVPCSAQMFQEWAHEAYLYLSNTLTWPLNDSQGTIWPYFPISPQEQAGYVDIVTVDTGVDRCQVWVSACGSPPQEVLDRLLEAIKEAWPETATQIAPPMPAPAEPEAEVLPAASHTEGESAAKENRQRGLRRADYRRRVELWDAIAVTWRKTHSYERCRQVIQEKHPHLLRKGKHGYSISYRLLRDVVEQGEAGLLQSKLLPITTYY